MHPVPSPTALAFAQTPKARHFQFPHHPLRVGNAFRGFLVRSFATTCRVARPPGGSDRVSSEGGYPLSFTLLGGSPSSSTQPTRTFTSGLPAGRSPFLLPDMTTVATG